MGNRHLVKLLNEAGHPITLEESLRSLSGKPMALIAEQMREIGIDLGDDFAERWYRDVPTIFGSGVEAIPHVEQAITAISDAKLPYCVASSGRVEKMHLTLGSTGLIKYFGDVLFSASMVPRGKPFPDLFLHAAKEMGFDPSRSIVIEDSINGTIAGVAAGMTVYSYCGDAHADREGLEEAGGILFDDMRALPSLIGIS
ncbi:MAG: HAD family hydrolase [Phyllobacterium sp.]